MKSFLCEKLDVQIDGKEFEDSKFYFWKHYPSPREYKKKEGPSEIDVTLELVGTVVFIEAKYRSGLSKSITYDKERDQIVRNLDVGLNYSQKGKKRFFLLIIKELVSMNKEVKFHTRLKFISTAWAIFPNNN